MITDQYCRTMAQYNQWQNNNLRAIVDKMSDEELRLDRGAFFSSIFATMNHLLWGDQLWISRFDGGDGPSVGGDLHDQLTADKAQWDPLRDAMDLRILAWANDLGPDDLSGDLTWYSGMLDRELTEPKALCVTHFFNHQTHHRGQIHAMLTAAGQKTEDTDLILMSKG